MKINSKKLEQKKVFHPCAIEIEISHRCPILCANCAIKEDIIKAKFSLNEIEILDILKQCKENNIYYYSLTGGEPFYDFELLLKIINKSPLDLIKINTNGFIFISPQKTRQVFQKLKDAGFGSRNKKIKSWLNISLGQQNTAGIPLENTVFACNEFFKFFSKEMAGISMLVFSNNDDLSMNIINEFINKFEDITGKKFDRELFPIKIIPSDGRACSTALKMNKVSDKKMKIKDLIVYYSNSGLALNCSGERLFRSIGMIGPRILLRADGTIFSCTGYSHLYKLGNIRSEKLEDMLTIANEDKVLKKLFKHGLKGLLNLAERVDSKIGERKISISSGPCDICRILTNFLYFCHTDINVKRFTITKPD